MITAGALFVMMAAGPFPTTMRTCLVNDTTGGDEELSAPVIGDASPPVMTGAAASRSCSGGYHGAQLSSGTGIVTSGATGPPTISAAGARGARSGNMDAQLSGGA